MRLQTDIDDHFDNPLDSVEEVLSSHDWVFERRNEDELHVQVSGTMGSYNLYFLWQEEFGAMELRCEYDLNIRKSVLDFAAKTLSAINAGLWLGHFDILENSRTPQFRHTSLFRGVSFETGADHIEDLVNIALNECERYFPVFDLLSKTRDQNAHSMEENDSLMLAMMDPAGRS